MAAPATQVKCPHCEWKGSARGLFGHVRFVHPGKESSVKTNLRANRNPYSVDNRPSLSGIQKNKQGPKSKEMPITMENVGVAFLVVTALKLIDEYFKTIEARKKAREEFIRQFQSRGHKPTTQGVF
jgi:hypothetical protein